MPGRLARLKRNAVAKATRAPVLALCGWAALCTAPLAQAGTYVIDNPGFTLTFTTSADGAYSALGGTDNLGYVPDHVNKLEDTYYQVYLPQLQIDATQNTHWQYDVSFNLTPKPGYTLGEGYLFMVGTQSVPVGSVLPTASADFNVVIQNAPGTPPIAGDKYYMTYLEPDPDHPGQENYTYDMEGGRNLVSLSEDNDGTMHLIPNDMTSISIDGHLVLDQPVGAVGLGQFISPLIALRVDRLVYSPPPAVPEPETWALMGLGVLGLWAGRRRARGQNKPSTDRCSAASCQVPS